MPDNSTPAAVLSDSADFVLDTANIPANAPVKIASAKVDVTSDYATATFKISVTTYPDSPDGVVYAIVSLTGGTPPGTVSQNIVNAYPLKGGGAVSTIVFPLVVPTPGAYTSLTVALPTYGSNIICMRGTAALKLNIVEISRPNNATWNPPLPATLSAPALFYDPSTFVKDDADRLYSFVMRAAWPKGTAFGEGFFVTPKATDGDPSGFDYEYQKIFVGVQDHDHTTGAETYHPGAGVDISNPGYDFVDVPISFPPPTSDHPGQFSLDIGLTTQDGVVIAWYWKVLTFTIGQWYMQCPPDKRPLLSENFKPLGKAKISHGANTGTGEAFEEASMDWSLLLYQEIKRLGFQHARLNVSLYNLLRSSDPKLARDNVDIMVQNALSAGITPVLTFQDLHAATGQDATGNAVFVDLSVDDLKAGWNILCDMYPSSGNNNTPYVAYNLLNEPHQFPTVETWLPVAKDLCSQIRAQDPNAYIIVSSPNYEEAVGGMAAHWGELKDTANLLSVHPYVSEDKLAAAIAANNAPFGVLEAKPGVVWNQPTVADQASVSRFIDILEASGALFVQWWSFVPNANWEQQQLGWLENGRMVLNPEGQWLLNEIQARRETGSAYVIPPPPPTADEILQAKIDATVTAQLAKLPPAQGGLSQADVQAMLTQMLTDALKALPTPTPAPVIDLTPLQTAETLDASHIATLTQAMTALQSSQATTAKTLQAIALAIALKTSPTPPVSDAHIQALIDASLKPIVAELAVLQPLVDIFAPAGAA